MTPYRSMKNAMEWNIIEERSEPNRNYVSLVRYANNSQQHNRERLQESETPVGIRRSIRKNKDAL